MIDLDKVCKIAELIQTRGGFDASWDMAGDYTAAEWAAAEALAAGPEVDLSFVDDPTVQWPGEEPPAGGAGGGR